MSGMLITKAELDRMRKKVLELERQERIRLRQEAILAWNNEKEIIKGLILGFEYQLNSNVSQAAIHNELRHQVEQYNGKKSEFLKSAKSLLCLPLPRLTKDIESETKLFNGKYKELVRTFKSQVTGPNARIEAYLKTIQKDENLQSISEKFVIENDSKITNFDFDFTQLKNDLAEAGDDKNSVEDTKLVVNEIEDMINSDSIFKSDKVRLMSIVSGIQSAIQTPKKGLVSSLIEFKYEKEDIRHRMDLLNEVYPEYLDEFYEYATLKKLSGEKAVPFSKIDFNDIEHIKAEKKKYHKLSIQENEQNYIRTQIDEVMTQFGYNLSQNIIFSDSDKGSHFLFEGTNGKNAMHVHVAENNQIMMEVVGIEENSKLEEQSGKFLFNNEINEAEQDNLYNEQLKTCEIQPQMFKELEKRGVRLEIKKIKEPKKRNIKKIQVSKIFNLKKDKTSKNSSKRIKNKNDKLRETKN